MELKLQIALVHLHTILVHVPKILTARILFIWKLVTSLNAALDCRFKKTPLLHMNKSRREGEAVLYLC